MIGRIVGDKYELVQELGSEGVFDVYRAIDRGRNRPTKIRLVRPQAARESSFIQDLEEVVQQHATFQHPGLERAYEIREDDGIWFIASEFEEGTVLEDRLKRLSSFSVPVAISLAIAVVEALEACHNAGLIHGDISARTVFSKQGEGVKLMQAGFWQAFRHSDAAARQMVVNMAPYLAPEITAGSMPSKTSDIYAVGVLLYRLLTGRYPYGGDSPQSYAEQHISAPYPSLKRSLASVPPALDEIIRKCLSKRPDERYANATELLRDLRLLQDALRFGKSVKWPLTDSAGEAVPSVAPVAEKPEAESAGKAKRVKSKRERDSDGLPLWLSLIGYLSTFLAATVIGFWMYWNINTSKEVEVPNVVGMSFTEAADQISDLGLKLRQRSEEVSDEPAGTILRTNPAANRKAKENSFVDATVSSGSRYVELPDLTGRTLEEAVGMLKTLNVKYQTETGRDRNKPIGTVIAQKPSAKQKVERNSMVTLTINSQNEENRRDVYTYSITVRIPESEEPSSVWIKVEMTDAIGTTTVHEAKHNTGEVFMVPCEGQGSRATFRASLKRNEDDEIWEPFQTWDSENGLRKDQGEG